MTKEENKKMDMANELETLMQGVSDDSPKMPEVMPVITMITDMFSKWKEAQRLKLLSMLNVGQDYLTCQMCGQVYSQDKFYISHDSRMKTKHTAICKMCATDIAMPPTEKGRKRPTRESVDLALSYLNKPMVDTVWQAAELEVSRTSSKKTDVWGAYIKTIAMYSFRDKTYRDSDNYKSGLTLDTNNQTEGTEEKEVVDQFEKNKEDVLKLLGYLPFENENIKEQPALYSQLVGFLDASEEGNDDMMRTASIISIVRSFSQLNKIDDMIASITENPTYTQKHANEYKTYQAMKKDISASITKLAQDSCISLKHSKNAKKGENTWTGKLRKLKETNLRESLINGFTIGECKAMRQILDINHEAILKQLSLDESEYADIISEQRTKLVNAQREKEQYKEICRILLRENLDFREVLENNDMMFKRKVVDLDELFSPFSARENNEDVLVVEGKNITDENINDSLDEGGDNNAIKD